MKLRNKVLSVLAAMQVKPPAVVFDVGANVGQSAREFRKHWPEALIYTFEPVPATFERLAVVAAGDDRMVASNVGLSRASGTRKMTSRGASTGNRVVSAADRRVELAEVAMVRGDEFLREHNIVSVEFMKIDAEGHDLDVLVGFAEALRESRIRIIQIEVGVSPDNEKCVSFESVSQFMFAMDYRLLGIYGFHPLAKLRARSGGTRRFADYADAVFVARDW